MATIRNALCAVCAALLLAGCGDTLAEQSIIGAGAGAGTAALLDGNLALGALVGAAGNVAYCDRYPTRC
jgi:glucokinase